MRKNTILSVITGAALLLFVAACSNSDDSINGNNNEQKEPTQTVQFSFTDEDFGEDEALTRATGAAEAKPQTIDMGDCEAEISVESEPAAKKTRGAQTPANGHYTIRAYQAGVLKGEMSGTFSGGNFTPDGGSQKSFRLPYGTYDFVAFNDDVTVSGNELTVTRNKVQTTRMGATTINITGSADVHVNFSMKHVGARLRTQFVCQKHIPTAITATLEATATNVIPVSVTYNPTTKAYTGTPGAIAAESNNSPASIQGKYWGSRFGQNYTYTSTCTDYHYFLPTTETSNLKLSFSAGTLFWKPLTATIPQLNTTLSMQPGKSYLVKIKLKPNYTYLMSDGTTGHFKDTAFGGAPTATAKTPIALVLDKDNHMAIALNDANGGATVRWCTNMYYNTQTNTHMVTNMDDALNSQAASGIDETWNSSYSTGSIGVKATNPDFLPFKAAADYNPGVAYSGSPALQWYLPSYSDFKWLFPLGFVDIPAITESYHSYYWYGYLAEVAFTQVGGTELASSKQYWSSSENNTTIAGFCAPSTSYLNWGANYKYYTRGYYVRPFLKY